jgi:hypothetical protein
MNSRRLIVSPPRLDTEIVSIRTSILEGGELAWANVRLGSKADIGARPINVRLRKRKSQAELSVKKIVWFVLAIC